MAVQHTDVGGGPTGSTTTLDLVGTTLHLVRVTPTQMRARHRVGTHHVLFQSGPTSLSWKVTCQTRPHTRHPKPTDGEVPEAYGLFWRTHTRPLPRAPPRGNQDHHRLPKQVE